MSEEVEEKKRRNGVSKKPKGESKKDKRAKKVKKEEAAAKAFTLLADEKAVDPALSSLFAVKPTPKPTAAVSTKRKDEAGDEPDAAGGLVVQKRVARHAPKDVLKLDEALENGDEPDRKRKRKRRGSDEDLEAAYLDRLARDDERDASKRRKDDHPIEAEVPEDTQMPDEPAAEVDDDKIDSDDDDAASPPPQHETQQTADENVLKANRTVFVGNVATSAITSKSAQKTLKSHLASFFEEAIPKNKDEKHKLESIRFRSTPYATAIPKKAAFARKEVMDATTKSTNAYVVYSSPQLAREAAKRLNGTVVLDRHIRVDEIAHPAATDHRRCVFVGNLGFVDDESNIQQANEDEGREVRKRGKEASDVEEGLWRTFSRCGNVESVRVIRDSTTRVGKGIAYVQFEDLNAVEAALLYDEKKFPPMLPRKLRVTRAKAIKRNSKPGSGRPTNKGPNNATGYQRKVTGEERSQAGRAGKLFGRAGAAKMKKPERNGRTGAMYRADNPNNTKLGEAGAAKPAGFKRPEDFVFEGHRASSKGGKTGLKLGGKAKGKGKPTTRSAKRGGAFKAASKKKPAA